ncbi:MAG TPA: hypothetical protein VK857_03935, partial [Desulforhopalus sp.]|nr:hypothetical protein [Desulforhopalus sp.]
KGLDTVIGGVDDDSVEVVTNAGRACIHGFRHQRDLPTATLVPKSVAVKSVRDEQKTFDSNKHRYAVNSTPRKETTP